MRRDCFHSYAHDLSYRLLTCSCPVTSTLSWMRGQITNHHLGPSYAMASCWGIIIQSLLGSPGSSTRNTRSVQQWYTEWTERTKTDDELSPPRGKSQRNSSAVSECQEELSNTIILLSTSRPHVKNQPSKLTKHQHYRPSTRKRMMSSFDYTPMIENGLGDSILLPDNSLQFLRLLSTRCRRGTDWEDMVKTTPP